MNNLNNFISEKKYLENLFQDSINRKIPVIDYEVGKLLEAIIFLKQQKSILEIGCGEGYSTYYILKNFKSGTYIGIDLNKDRLAKAKNFISSSFPDVNATFINGNALNIIPELDNFFDFVFIDGAKFEYKNYLEVTIRKLEDNAIIIADNVFFDEKIFAKHVKDHDKNSVNGLKQFIEFIEDKNLFETIFLDIGDGLSISRYKKK